MRKILATGFFVFLSLAFSLQTYAQNARVYSINPNQVQTGAASFPLIINGSFISKNSRVEVNGVPLDTISLSFNKLKATVPANFAATAGTLQVRVASRNNRLSNTISLTVSGAPVGNYNWAALTAKLNNFVQATVPGLTFMISRHGKIIYSQAFGNQTVNTVLPIASATKMPSMLTILTLVDDGVLNLDTPISVYLAGRVNVPPDKANITMRMLMNHTSGLSGTQDAGCLGDRTTTLQACAQQILNLNLTYQPGTRFDYGGNGMQLAGYVAEVLAGESWNQFFARKVGIPLGLTRYTYGNTNNPRVPGGAFSDVSDYTKFLQMYLSGGVYGDTRIVSHSIYAEMQTDQWRGLQVINNPGGNRMNGYSYGWWHTAPDYLQSQPQPQTPGLELSDQGAFGCTPWIDLEYNYTAIILIQGQISTGTVIWNEIRPLIIEQMRNNS